MNWGDNWAGAQLVQSINLKAYNLQPTVSFKICEHLSVGAGLMMTWGKFDLSRSMLPVGAANAQNVALNNIIQSCCRRH
jgi:long-chain fatty acid transport protein